MLALNAYMDNPSGDLGFVLSEVDITYNKHTEQSIDKTYNFTKICEKGADKYLSTGYIGSAKNFISVLDIIKSHLSKNMKNQEGIFDILI